MRPLLLPPPQPLAVTYVVATSIAYSSYVIDMVPSVELLHLSGAVVAATASARAVAGKFVRSQAAATLVREVSQEDGTAPCSTLVRR